MKKIGFILLMFLTSCAYEKVDKGTYIEKDVVDQMVLNKTSTDTLFLYRAADEKAHDNGGYHYYFKQNHKTKQLELAYKYEAIPGMISIPLHFFVIFLLSIGLSGFATALYITDLQNKLKNKA